MAKTDLYCPACSAAPLSPAPGDRLVCPRGCVVRADAAFALALLSEGRKPEFSEGVNGLSLDAYDLPVYLGYVMAKGCRPLLWCVGQTAEECFALLRVSFDLRKCEPLVIALLGCAGTAGRGAA